MPSNKLSSILLWPILLPLLVSTVQSEECSTVPKLDAPAFSRITFDYLIIGGGTAGLTLASKLSENQNIVVGVLEAGIFHKNDPLVDIPGNSGKATGNSSYDWNFPTTPQARLGGRSVPSPRGKMLGGSSGLNLMAWTRASKDELDSFDSFAPDSGWNWDGLLPYFKKTENVLLHQRNPFPGIAQETADDTLFDGHAGPVKVSLNAIYSDIVPQYVKTLNSLGIMTNPAPNNGSSTGISNSLISIDRASGTRSYAATAYFCPSSSRRNLHVLLNAQVTKVTFQERASPSMPLTARGVEFLVGSRKFTATARREVILSAGTVQTPQLLELSGIGNPTVLKNAGVTSLVNSPGVGENLQEHVYSLVQFLLQEGHHTFDELRNNATFAAEQASQYNASRTGILAATDSSLAFLPLKNFVKNARSQSIVAVFDEVPSQMRLSSIQRLQYSIQRNWLTRDAAPLIEIILFSKGLIAPSANQSYITLLGGIQHPLSRGSIHINSSNPVSPPIINGNYLSTSFDVAVLLETIKFIGNLQNVPSMASVVQNMTSPPNLANDVDTINYIKATLSTGGHLVGTAAMAPYDLGGVVNGQLKVYRTKNLRVVDASIIPLLVGTHIQALVYAIGAKAADMILCDYH